MNEDIMSPEDAAALLAFAGPMFQQAKAIDSNGMRDEYGNMPKSFSNEIVQALDLEVEKAKRQHRESKPNLYATNIPLPPAYNNGGPPPDQYIPAPPQYIPAPPPVDDGQMEFNFSQSEQKKTNDLLEQINRKLTKVLDVLESKKKSVTILEPTKNNNGKTDNTKETVTKLT